MYLSHPHQQWSVVDWQWMLKTDFGTGIVLPGEAALTSSTLSLVSIEEGATDIMSV